MFVVSARPALPTMQEMGQGMQPVSVNVEIARRSGALDQRAYQLLGALIADDVAYEATARRVFLRMVVHGGDDWQCRPVPGRELVYADRVENARVTTLLTAFRDARLVVCDDGGWAAAADWQLRGWPMLATWCARFGAAGFALQRDLAEAAARWAPAKRPSYLWSDDARMASAIRAMRAPEPWLNVRERAFVTASLRRRIRMSGRHAPGYRASAAGDGPECSCCGIARPAEPKADP
jgi:hypothetical protein